MESPVVVDKPPEYHGKDDRGFPFEEEEGSGAWSDLAARHPDIAARLRQHPAAANWARKRRPSSQDADDFGDSFGGFDRFPFDDIPPEFREHFPSHFNRRFGREERAPQSPQPQTSQSPPQPHQHTAATQTEHSAPPHTQHGPSTPQVHTSIPQYGLRNTVDLGQKSAADPSLVDAEERNQRSMSAPPESRGNHTPRMNAQNHPDPHAEQPSSQQPQKVRNIPIFVEGRDQPVINDSLDGSTHFGESKPTYAPHHPQQPPHDNSYFTEDPAPMYHQPANFSKAFGTPFTKPYRQGQPFAQQKVYPQTFARGASPARSQSPKPQQQEEIKIPVKHEKPQQQQPRPQPKPQQQPPKPQQQQQPPPQQQHAEQPPKQPSPPPRPQQAPPDPITQILAIQTDVLNLMTEVEKFTGTKKDKQYIWLDEMLTRNLIKLDTIETEGKENIRNARKEAIRCIQKCIAVLEAKADSKNVSTPQPQENENQGAQDEEMKAGEQVEKTEETAAQNGEVEMKETPKEEVNTEQNAHQEQEPATENKDVQPQAADTRPETEAKQDVDKKPKKATKKRDKSKDKAGDGKDVETMQVDNKGESQQPMEVDGAASQ